MKTKPEPSECSPAKPPEFYQQFATYSGVIGSFLTTTSSQVLFTTSSTLNKHIIWLLLTSFLCSVLTLVLSLMLAVSSLSASQRYLDVFTKITGTVATFGLLCITASVAAFVYGIDADMGVFSCVICGISFVFCHAGWMCPRSGIYWTMRRRE